jgi:hypothetical protein
MRSQIKILLREGLLDEEQYFNATIPDDDKRHASRYFGDNVVWYGDPEQMIVVHRDDVDGMFGNEYNQDKMDFIVNLIGNPDDREENRVELECSYGFGNVLSIKEIQEEQNAEMYDRFQSDYNGLKAPRSTGDEELDRYLAVEYLDEFDELALHVEDQDLFRLFDDNKTYVALGHISPEKLLADFHEITIP